MPQWDLEKFGFERSDTHCDVDKSVWIWMNLERWCKYTVIPDYCYIAAPSLGISWNYYYVFNSKEFATDLTHIVDIRRLSSLTWLCLITVYTVIINANYTWIFNFVCFLNCLMFSDFILLKIWFRAVVFQKCLKTIVSL